MAERHPDRVLSETEWAVRHAAADMARRGVWPTFDRLCDCQTLADVGESGIRAACNELVRLGKFPAPPQPKPTACGSARNKRLTNKELNIALYRIVDDKGSVYESLATITGLSVDSVKCRVNSARGLYPTEELDPYAGRLTLAESSQASRYVERHVLRTGDPAVREFASKVFTAHRARPDARSQTRDERACS